MPLQQTSGAASYDAFGGGVAAVPNYIEDYFSTFLYSGTGAPQTITNGIDLATKGGLVWYKRRSGASDHGLVDTARGMTSGSSPILASNLTDSQIAINNYVIANTTGFSFGANATGTNANASGSTYVSWAWAKAPKFFDVVTYTGNSTNSRQVFHGLQSEPGMIVVKNITTGSTDWMVYHRSRSGGDRMLVLNSTAAEATYSNASINDATSTWFRVDNTLALNETGNTYVAYLFAHNAGGFGLSGTDNVISCGSFTYSAGTTVDLGYEPQAVLFKVSNTNGNWFWVDNMRGWTTDGNGPLLSPNTSGAEGAFAAVGIAPTATGFRVPSGFGNGNTIIYIAIRRGPMRTPTTGTSVFSPYTATLSAGTSVNAGLTPDLLFAKFRPGQDNPRWVDRLRGFANATGGSNPELYSNDTSAEATSTAWSFNWNNTGYVIGNALNGLNCILYAFRRAPGTFDEVCYTGTGVARTVAHNLTVVPELIIVKSRNTGGSAGYGWISYCAYLNNSVNAGKYYIYLNRTDAAGGPDDIAWGGISPTAAQFNVGFGGSAYTDNAASGVTYVAYLFASCPGVSKVGSYTGTGTTQTINCGFTTGARFVMIKATSTTGDWLFWDSARGIVAGNDPYLRINSNAGEVTGTDWVDTATTGFELSNEAGNLANTNGVQYIFLSYS